MRFVVAQNGRENVAHSLEQSTGIALREITIQQHSTQQ